MAGPLAGRVAVVTGVSRRIGIGYGVARRLAVDGADVVAHSWTEHDAEMPWGADPIGADGVIAALRNEIGEGGGRVTHIEADFEHPLAPRAVIEQAVADFGRVDILVANHARSSHEAFGQLTAAELDRCLRVNVTATLLLVQAFADLHDDANTGGRVVLFSSAQHLVPMPDEIPYIAGKGALVELTKSLASALVRRRIMVNCINPGGTDTGYAGPEVVAAEAAKHPQGRWGTPDDAARLIAWLVSGEAGWVTGQVINSDGGWYL